MRSQVTILENKNIFVLSPWQGYSYADGLKVQMYRRFRPSVNQCNPRKAHPWSSISTNLHLEENKSINPKSIQNHQINTRLEKMPKEKLLKFFSHLNTFS